MSNGVPRSKCPEWAEHQTSKSGTDKHGGQEHGRALGICRCRAEAWLGTFTCVHAGGRPGSSVLNGQVLAVPWCVLSLRGGWGWREAGLLSCSHGSDNSPHLISIPPQRGLHSQLHACTRNSEPYEGWRFVPNHTAEKWKSWDFAPLWL